MIKKIILSFIAGVIVVQKGIADNKTAKLTSGTFEPMSDLATDDPDPATNQFLGLQQFAVASFLSPLLTY